MAKRYLLVIFHCIWERVSTQNLNVGDLCWYLSSSCTIIYPAPYLSTGAQYVLGMCKSPFIGRRQIVHVIEPEICVE